MTIQDRSNVPCSRTHVTGNNGNVLNTGSQVISEESYVPKIRKPYTITKQREIWSEEEHKRFLEALKLYGRAWSKIKVYVGTKTAVQIRSHAQKFFTKVVRGSNKSNSVEHIVIPPPRPKRKPTYPYPRKIVVPAKKEASLNLSCDQENHSPTSDNLGTEDSHTLYASCSEDKQLVQENVSESDQSVSVKLELLPKHDVSDKFEATICTKRLRLFGKNLSIMDVGKLSTSSASFSNKKS